MAFIYGKSKVMLDIRKTIVRIAASNLPVFIEGETGTGKSLLAGEIHRLSTRRANAFCKLDCATLAPSLIESELFGHERGAFTSANAARKGLFEVAEGGTIFLDEVENLDLNLQTKLLSVLEDRRIRRVGSKNFIDVDFRLISASNDHLQQKVMTGTFRKDLFFRLRGTQVMLPPLRERRQDIAVQAAHFLSLYNEQHGDHKRFSKAAKSHLLDHLWPGNSRELRSAIEEAAVKSDGDEICAHNFSLELQIASLMSSGQNNHLSLSEIERRYITMILHLVDFNKTRAAGILQIGLNTLYRKIKAYNLETRAQ
jgi:DNA-binding NtrC family response regulator